MKSIDICANMMVKNSEDVLPMSLSYIDDNFGELNILFDPLTSDKSLYVIENFKWKSITSINIEYETTENFSDRCNKLYSMGSKEYILHIDADEVIDCCDWEIVTKIMSRSGAEVGVFRRYNLLNKTHYNTTTFPDFQFRVFNKESGIRHNGKAIHSQPVFDKYVELPYDIIHFGDLRNKESLVLKCNDLKKFMENDPWDGAGIKEYGDDWYYIRNTVRKTSPAKLPIALLNMSMKYGALVELDENNDQI